MPNVWDHFRFFGLYSVLVKYYYLIVLLFSFQFIEVNDKIAYICVVPHEGFEKMFWKMKIIIKMMI